MVKKCMYCETKNERRLELMTPIANLNVSTLHLYREQSYPGRCVLVYHEHIQKLTDLKTDEYNAFFADVSKAAHVLTKLYHPEKMNYLVLGDICPHLHLHLVPKYQNGADWGKMFQMMPEAHKLLTMEEETAEVLKIKKALEEWVMD